ncbi:DUF3017 domain-containing protein [Streptomyces sp. NPDC096176]|uniref:DUF3017 domain-containing protein n=1 Tax=Streptomyces sp. NPDC096176 TaxID=3366079 RepID=UPI00381852B2
MDVRPNDDVAPQAAGPDGSASGPSKGPSRDSSNGSSPGPAAGDDRGQGPADVSGAEPAEGAGTADAVDGSTSDNPKDGEALDDSDPSEGEELPSEEEVRAWLNGTDPGPDAGSGEEASVDGPQDGPGGASEDSDDAARRAGSRRPPTVTRDTARPEGGGRAAPRDAPAPARQWPLLTVLTLTGIGLLIIGTDAFADAFRVGTILIGAGLIVGAVLRRVTPSVGMLAVRSRFTDMITYGLLGTMIVLLALVAQPKPWLDVPFLEDAVHFTVR